MRLATWNVNSVKARRDRLLAFLDREAPDVLCLQELKVADEAFDREAVEAAGYHAAVFGQRTYNGVAILSRAPLDDVRRGLDDEDAGEARLVSATVAGLRVLSAYFPNGQTVGSDKYRHKLAWMARLRAYLDRHHAPDEPLVLAGDFNVALDERDVRHPERWITSVLFHPEVRDALDHVRGFGLVDVFRPHHPEGGVYTWWDYRQLSFPKNDGLRIDHVFATAPVAERCRAARVDRDERKGKQPSDHAPVIVELDWPPR